MSSGKTHDQATIIAALAFLPLTQLIPASPYLPLHIGESISLSFGAFSGLLFSPDLDIHSRPYLRWGWFRFIWFPYKKFIKHRSPISHTPIFSQLFQLIYFLAVLQGFLYLLQILLSFLVQISPLLSQFLQRVFLLFPELTWYSPSRFLYRFWQAHPTWVTCYVLGVVIAGSLHIAMDILSSDN